MKKGKKIKAVILDLDQTLTTDKASWIQFTELIGADSSIHIQLYEDFKSGKITYDFAKKELIKLWKETGRTDKQYIKSLFNKIQYRPNVNKYIKYLQSKYRLCLISGAMDVFVEVVSEDLSIKDYYASTKLLFDENDELIDLDYKLSRGEEKLEFLFDFCKRSGLSPKECAAIGDGESDVPIFDEVGLPILFIAKETTNDLMSKYPYQLKDWKEIQQIL